MTDTQQEEQSSSGQREQNAVFGQPTAAQSSMMIDDVPFESVPLPSGGKIYPQDSQLHSRSSVDIRVMTAREEDILTSRALIKKGTVITELLKSCILDKGIDVQDMIAGDRNAIMVALRITGYGANYPAEIECSSCDHAYENEFNLAQLPLKRLDIEPTRVGENAFSFKLPVSGQDVIFKFLTGKDEEDINITQEKMKKLGIFKDSVVTTKLKHSILQLGEITDKGKISRFVETMRAGDSKALRRFMEKSEPGMIMKQEASCPACGNEEEVSMPLGAGFFWPE